MTIRRWGLGLALGAFFSGIVAPAPADAEVDRHPPVGPSGPVRDRKRIPSFERWGSAAVAKFRALGEADRARILASIDENVLTMDEWLRQLAQSRWEFLCLGERHYDEHRRFMAEEFFKRLPLDVLFLETEPDKLQEMIAVSDTAGGTAYLLKAEISGVLNAVRSANPDVELIGAEAEEDDRGGLSRDSWVAKQIRARYVPQARNAALYGALHCTNGGTWYYNQLLESGGTLRPESMISVDIRNAGSAEALPMVLFLSELGITESSFVIPDVNALEPEIYEWRLISPSTYQDFDSAVTFRAD